MSKKKQPPQQIGVLIVAKDPSRFKKAAQFLSRRGWQSGCAGNIKEAVEYTVKYRPTFVLVSFSHTNGNITKLPNLLKQTFNVTPIAFGESSDGKTMARLNACKLKHIFYGALSGPSIHMRIKKILMEQEREEKMAEQRKMQAPPEMPAKIGESTVAAKAAANNQAAPPSAADQIGGMRPGQKAGESMAYVPKQKQQGHYSEDEEMFDDSYEMEENIEQDQESGESYWGKKKPNHGAGDDSDLDYSNDSSAESFQPDGNSDSPHQGSQANDSSFDPSGGFQPNPEDLIDDDSDSPFGSSGSGGSVDYSNPNDQNPMGAGGSHDDPANGSMGENSYQASSQQGGHFNPQEQAGGGQGPKGNAQQSMAYMPNQDGNSAMGPGGDKKGMYNPQAQGSMGEDPQGMGDGSFEGHAPSQGSNAPAGGENFAPEDGSMANGPMGESDHPTNDHSEGFDAMDPAAAAPMGEPEEFDPAATDQNQDMSEEAADVAASEDATNNFDPAAAAPVEEDGSWGDEESFMDPTGDLFEPEEETAAESASASSEEASPSHADEDATEDFSSEPAAQAAGESEEEEETSKASEEKDHLSKLASVMNDAFKEACAPIEDASLKIIEKLRSISVIGFQSETETGYLLLGKPEGVELDNSFFETLRKSIEDKMQLNKIEMKMDSEFDMAIPQTAFVSWAYERGDFVLMNQHMDHEIAIAYFAMPSMPKIEPSSQVKGMSVVSINNLVTDVTTEFEAYLNLQKNDKMLLYIKSGGSISQKQKDRLIHKKVDEIYIPDAQTEKFRVHVAHKFITDLVNFYHEELAKKSGVA